MVQSVFCVWNVLKTARKGHCKETGKETGDGSLSPFYDRQRRQRTVPCLLLSPEKNRPAVLCPQDGFICFFIRLQAQLLLLPELFQLQGLPWL